MLNETTKLKTSPALAGQFDGLVSFFMQFDQFYTYDREDMSLKSPWLKLVIH